MTPSGTFNPTDVDLMTRIAHHFTLASVHSSKAAAILRSIPVRRLPAPPLVPRDLELLLAPSLGLVSHRPSGSSEAETVRP